jgi:hypothetical protein
MAIEPGTTPGGILSCSYCFRFYLARALDHAGMAGQCLASLKPWLDLLSLHFSTWPEKPGKTRSDSHAWSASRLRSAHAGGWDPTGVTGVCLRPYRTPPRRSARRLSGISSSPRNDPGPLRANRECAEGDSYPATRSPRYICVAGKGIGVALWNQPDRAA